MCRVSSQSTQFPNLQMEIDIRIIKRYVQSIMKEFVQEEEIWYSFDPLYNSLPDGSIFYAIWLNMLRINLRA